MWPGLHKNLGISRTTSANSKQKEKSGVHRLIVACLRCVCRYIICPTVGSEVQEIRGWGKHSAELLWERFQGLAEGVEQVPSAQCWFCQVVLGEVRSPVAPVQSGAGCLLSGQLCRGAGGDITGMCWSSGNCPAQPSLPVQEVGESKRHGWGSQQAEGSKCCSAKAPCTRPSPHKSTLFLPCPCPHCCSMSEGRAPWPW